MKNQTSGQPKRFLEVLTKKQASDRPPFWFMRQAGRYLPEYRELRAKAGGFLDMVYNPDFATEVTLQPLRRFNMDAAILFSDILVVPQALGQHLEFVAGEGPKLKPVRSSSEVDALRYDDRFLSPVYETVTKLRAEMLREGFGQTALIGFAGAPWTVATYMVEGGGSKNFEHVKHMAYQQPEVFGVLIDKIVDGTIDYLSRQIDAGAEALQIFDSWAGVLDENEYARWVIEPTKKITAALKIKYSDIPLIGFPKGSGILYERYARECGIDALGVDPQVPLSFAKQLQTVCPVQGNLDPVALLTGGEAMENRAKEILKELSEGPFIFNLGHGVIKDTPPEHVEKLSDLIKGWDA